MTVSINGVTIPTSPDIRDNGSYVWLPGESHENGLGVTVSAGLPSATWRFTFLEKAGFTWFTTTILAGALSRSVSAVLLDDKDNEIAYSSVVVRYPTYSRRQNGGYIDVEVVIDTMVV
jgi:hypothetical protein